MIQLMAAALALISASQLTLKAWSASGDMSGTWSLSEAIENPLKEEYGSSPFPVSIEIIQKGSNSGTIVIKLEKQSVSKKYSFVSGQTVSDLTIQTYESQPLPYTLNEFSQTIYSEPERTISIHLNWTKIKEGGYVEWTSPGSYKFSLNDDGSLSFVRTDGEESNLTTFKAIYQRAR